MTPSLWGDEEADLASFMVQPVKTFWCVQYGGKVPLAKCEYRSYGIYAQNQGVCYSAKIYNCSVSLRVSQEQCYWLYGPDLGACLSFWNSCLFPSPAWELLVCWGSCDQSCANQKRKRGRCLKRGVKISTPLPSPQIFFELFVFLIVFSQIGKKAPVAGRTGDF